MCTDAALQQSSYSDSLAPGRAECNVRLGIKQLANEACALLSRAFFRSLGTGDRITCLISTCKEEDIPY